MSEPRERERCDATQGRLIALEGIDGAGTTTQARRLVDRLIAAKERAILTREPSDGPIGLLIRQVLTGRVVTRTGNGETAPFDSASVALLFAADRLDHIHAEIEPALERGVHVVSDRYVLSSLAYQSLDNEIEWVRSINSRARYPDLTLLLDVTAEEALSRRAATRTLEERFEQMEMQRRVAGAYTELANEDSSRGRVLTVDGMASVDEVEEELWKAVSELLIDSP